MCAPSNQAIHGLCARFVAAHPSVSCALVSHAVAMADASPALQQVWAVNWATEQAAIVRRMAAELSSVPSLAAVEQLSQKMAAVKACTPNTLWKTACHNPWRNAEGAVAACLQQQYEGAWLAATGAAQPDCCT